MKIILLTLFLCAVFCTPEATNNKDQQRSITTKNEKNQAIVVEEAIAPKSNHENANSPSKQGNILGKESKHSISKQDQKTKQKSVEKEVRQKASSKQNVKSGSLKLDQIQQQNAKEEEEYNKFLQSQIGKQQQELEEEVEEQERAEMSEWVAQEIKQDNSEAYPADTIQFLLDSEEERVVQWEGPQNGLLRLYVTVVELDEEGEMNPIQSPEENQFVDLSVGGLREQNEHLGKIYISKQFRILFDKKGKKFLRLTNKYPQQVMVSLYLENTPLKIDKENAIKDQLFGHSALTMGKIYQEFIGEESLREHEYKYEWGFHEKQLEHDSKYLGLTGIELFLIIATACLQIHFLKSLLDNRAVV